MRCPQIPTRPFKDDVRLSLVGCGAIVVCGMPQDQADALVADSIAKGVNYFDSSPTYGKNGEGEEKLGRALEPHRKNVFLACKTIEREAEGAKRELERSLKRLRTDHFDLYQVHAVCSLDDVAKLTAPGGAISVFRQAKEQGLARYLGFSAHSEAAAAALFEHLPFDSVLFPVNFVCYASGHFGPGLLKLAQKHGAARMAIKSLAHTPWIKGHPRRKEYPNCWYQPVLDSGPAELAFRFTLSEDITAMQPPGDVRLYRDCLEYGQRFTPLTPDERADLLAQAAGTPPVFKV